MPGSQALKDDIEEIFFSDFADEILIDTQTHHVLVDFGIDLVDELGQVIDTVNALWIKNDVPVVRNFGFVLDGKAFKFGKLLERSPDGMLLRYEFR